MILNETMLLSELNENAIKCWHSLAQGSGHKAPSPYVIRPCLATTLRPLTWFWLTPLGPVPGLMG